MLGNLEPLTLHHLNCVRVCHGLEGSVNHTDLVVGPQGRIFFMRISAGIALNGMAQQKHEPLCLEGVFQAFARFGRDPMADLCNFQQLLFPPGIGFKIFCHDFAEPGMTSRPGDNRPVSYDHRFPIVDFVDPFKSL